MDTDALKKISESIKSDFAALWHFNHDEGSLRVSTPYLLSDSSLFAAVVTEEKGNFIVSDDGCVMELIDDRCSCFDAKMKSALEDLATKLQIKTGEDKFGSPIFFKESNDASLISSMLFDVANFSVVATIPFA